MKRLIFFLCVIAVQANAQDLKWTAVTPKNDASFRGLSVVDDQVAWISGSKGWVGRSTSGGKDWEFTQVKDHEKLEFRSVYGFDAQTAVIANVGSPAHVLLTTDGGKNWQLVYSNDNPDAFFDGVDFWNEKEGLIYGDPLNGRVFLLRTLDGGRHWEEVPEANRPAVAEGEASFAASGTGIRCMSNNRVTIATGGKVSELLTSTDKGMTWIPVKAPIIQGESTTGIFSVAYKDEKNAVIVGGDYLRDTVSVAHVFYTTDGGKTWLEPKVPTRGYRECVEYISGKQLIAIGPRGTDVSDDGGIHWRPFSDEKGFHVVRKARKGKRIIAAGGKGLITVLR